MEIIVNDLSIGLLLWQIFLFIIALVVIFFLVKLGRKMMRYYGNKNYTK